MDPVRAQQPNHEEALQKFVRFVDEKREPGISGTENETAYFCPESDLKDYFSDHDRLEGLLRCVLPSTGPVPVQRNPIKTQYTKVFAILLHINRGKFIKYFIIHNSLSDEKLPFDTRPENFPANLEDIDTRFFQDFYEHQWMFCAPTLSYERFKDWQARTILPIISKVPLGTGGSSETYRIELQSTYNRLEVNRGTKNEITDPCPNTFVLKTYHSREAEEQCRKEVEGFVTVRSAISGSNEPGVIGFYGSYKHGETWNIILEYANEKTLEDYFTKHRTPRTGPGIYDFWESLLSLNRALEGIHDLVYTDKSARQGWHQDVKPRNILLSTRNGRLEFKLADLGLSHFRDKVEEIAYDWDTQGTRTYGTVSACMFLVTTAKLYEGAPECYRHDTTNAATRRQVTPGVDVWSLGCILSEAAVWLVLGLTGLQQYRDLRKLNAKEHGIEDLDCFHNGEVILRCVEERLQKLPSNLQRCDIITEHVLTMIKDHMLLPRQHRRSANTLWWKSSKVLKDSASMKDIDQNCFEPYRTVRSSTSPSTDSRASEREATSMPPRKETGSNGQTRMTSSLPPSPELQGTTSQQVKYPYTESPGIISTDRPAHLSQLSNGSTFKSMNPLDGVTQDAFGGQTHLHSPPAERGLDRKGSRRKRHSAGEDRFTPMSSQQNGLLPEPFQTEPPISHRDNPSVGYSTDHSVNPVSQEMHPQTPSMAQRPSLTTEKPGTGIELQKSSPDAATKARDSFRVEISTDTLPFSNQHVGAEPISSNMADVSQHGISVLAISPNVKPNTGHPIVKPTYDPHPHSTPTPQPPFLSFDDAKVWRERRKKKGLSGLASAMGNLLGGAKDIPLPHDHLMNELKNRDHVFLIDDSTSMREHWDDVILLLDILAYIVKKNDKNGIDLFFTMSDTVCTNEKKTTELVELAKKQRPRKVKEGTEHLSNIYHRLGSILGKYQRRLEEEDQRKPRNAQSRPWHADDPKDVRELNLYIFTDGIWQPESDAVPPIKSLGETLDRFKKPNIQVGVQFIQFGNDEVGSARLSFLDNGLISTGLTRDLVDTEPFFKGNIWKMLLGGTNKWFDSDNAKTPSTV